jgi:hypothetical protein
MLRWADLSVWEFDGTRAATEAFLAGESLEEIWRADYHELANLLNVEGLAEAA